MTYRLVHLDHKGHSNTIPNLINWFIGNIMINIWMTLGMLFGLIGDWQTPLDAIQSIPADYGPHGLSYGIGAAAYLNDMFYEV